jgi:hypothetical protein
MVRYMMRRGSTARPLPPLHPRANGSSPRGMELVLPVYPEPPHCSHKPATSESKGLDYGRRLVKENTSSSGGLEKLFHLKESQVTPANS